MQGENAHQTLLYFDKPQNYTANLKGTKEINIMSNLFSEKHHITLILHITSQNQIWYTTSLMFKMPTLQTDYTEQATHM